MTARVYAEGKLSPEHRSSPTQKLNQPANRPIDRVAPAMRPAAGRNRRCPSGRPRSRSRGSHRSFGRRVLRGFRTSRRGRSGRGSSSSGEEHSKKTRPDAVGHPAGLHPGEPLCAGLRRGYRLQWSPQQAVCPQQSDLQQQHVQSLQTHTPLSQQPQQSQAPQPVVPPAAAAGVRAITAHRIRLDMGKLLEHEGKE